MNVKPYPRLALSVVFGVSLLLSLLLALPQAPRALRAAPAALFVTPGGAGNCTQADPCALQTALSLANRGDTLTLAQGTYTGNGGAVITLTQSITLYGGWDGAPAAPVRRDPALYPTILDGEGQRRVIVVGETTTPTISGFTITRGNATGLLGSLFADSDAGGGIYSRDASPLIHNNIITGNLASTRTGVRALGGGVYLANTAGAVLRDNEFAGNSAGIGIQQGDGGGLFANGSFELQNNTFHDNIACQSCSSASGGGAYIGWVSTGAVIAGNHFTHNQSKTGGGLQLVWSKVHVHGNTFADNAVTFSGGGLYTYYDQGSTIQSNTFFSNTTAWSGGAVAIYIANGAQGTQLHNNFIAHNRAAYDGGALYAHSDWNICAITATHNTLVNNGVGIAIGQHMTATLINNIIFSHTLGITTTDSTANILADHTLFWANADDGARGAYPVDGDPAFASPALDDYHITPASAALDRGIAVPGVTTDLEGDPRPIGAGYDIGADELYPRIYLPLVIRQG
ncbi:MAG: right-handed parallel beta-helix repeat-containing protein [Anaerolineae bacterium]|jgi:parallel beta-helix repeat protein|nr:right-handed parallel beta-helix repeat-containing protein [Anaerolineae bacterium]